MDDRTMLMLAAKASGINGWFANDSPNSPIFFDNPNNRSMYGVWNPLADDGDALRLAVKLGFQFGLTMDTGGMAHWGPVTYTDYKRQANGDPYKYNGPHETHGEDPYAATRRAITRAAAEIGKANEGV